MEPSHLEDPFAGDPPLYSLQEATERALLLNTRDHPLEYEFFLALKQGTEYLGRALIKFALNTTSESLYINLSVQTVWKVIVNGVDCTFNTPGLYENHRIKLWKVKNLLKD